MQQRGRVGSVKRRTRGNHSPRTPPVGRIARSHVDKAVASFFCLIRSVVGRGGSMIKVIFEVMQFSA